jgi:hypothetical protein
MTSRPWQPPRAREVSVSSPLWAKRRVRGLLYEGLTAKRRPRSRRVQGTRKSKQIVTIGSPSDGTMLLRRCFQ